MIEQTVSDSIKADTQEDGVKEIRIRAWVTLPMDMKVRADTFEQANLAGEIALTHLQPQIGRTHPWIDLQAEKINALLEKVDLHWDGRLNAVGIEVKNFADSDSAAYWQSQDQYESGQRAGALWAWIANDPAAIEQVINMDPPICAAERNAFTLPERVAHKARGWLCSRQEAIEFWNSVCPNNESPLPNDDFVGGFIRGADRTVTRFADGPPHVNGWSVGHAQPVEGGWIPWHAQESTEGIRMRVTATLPLDMTVRTDNWKEALAAGECALKRLVLKIVPADPAIEANAEVANAILKTVDLEWDGRLDRVSLEVKRFSDPENTYYWQVDDLDEIGQRAGAVWARKIKHPAAVERVGSMDPSDSTEKGDVFTFAERLAHDALGRVCSREEAIAFWKTACPNNEGVLPNDHLVTGFTIGAQRALTRFSLGGRFDYGWSLVCTEPINRIGMSIATYPEYPFKRQ